eukprot:scaffold1697_cov180-Amphora_coffeaeformis.AAC.22
MGRLALVVGSTLSVSSQSLLPAAPVEDYDAADPTHQTLLRPLHDHSEAPPPTVVMAVSGSLQAIASIHVYPRIAESSATTAAAAGAATDNDNKNNLPIHSRVAEIQIQVLPATSALSSHTYRQAHYRVELPAIADDDTSCTTTTSTRLVFSANQRFLLLQLPPYGDLILFQLRKPRNNNKQSKNASKRPDPLPQPTYLQHPVTTATVIAVATQPKYVTTPTPITALTAGPNNVFWLGTACGSLYVLVGRPYAVVKVGTKTTVPTKTTILQLPRILALDWISQSSSPATTEAGDNSDHNYATTIMGRLAVLDIHQQVHIMETTTSTPSPKQQQTNLHNDPRNHKKNLVQPNATMMATLPSTTAIHAVVWLEPHYLVTLHQDKFQVTLFVWYLHHNHHDGKDDDYYSWIPCRTHVIRKDAMEGLKRCTIKSSTTTATISPPPVLQYDTHSETLVIRAAFIDGSYCWPMGSLWSWRTNVQGWTQAVASPGSSWLVGRRQPQHDQGMAQELIVTSSSLYDNKSNDDKIRKERYELALLSPPSSRATAAYLGLPNPIVLTSHSVWYPTCTEDAGGGQMEWMELPLPTEYMSLYGIPTIAAWSTTAVAVAAKRGVLVVRPACSSSTSIGSKWQQFADSSAEDKLQVLAMAWWDNLKPNSSHADDAVLVALVRIQQNAESSDKRTTFLSCWSSRFVDANKQLLIPVPSYDNGENSWGMSLPEGMGTDLCLDLLCEGDRAVVLVSSRTSRTMYRAYQMQIVPAPPKTEDTSYQEHRPFSVLATCIATGTVESCSKLWLASTSFGFDLVALKSGKLDLRLLDYVATLGVWRQTHGIVDALAISPDTVVAVGEVCRENSTVVVDLWPADRTRSSVSWTLLLSNGKLITWKLAVASKPADHVVLGEPIDEEQDETKYGPRWVNENSRLVGKVCHTESTSAWMQGAGRMTNNELFLGRMAGGRFGYAIAAGQSCRQMHRMLGEDFESEIFLPDFLRNEVFGPGDLVLLPPIFVSPMYLTILENPESLRDYLNLPITKEKDRNVILLALRLLIFVSVDRMATNKSSSSAAREARIVFQAAVAAAREILGKESLRFVAFIIELARQMEPSRFEHLLPLPPPENENIGRLLEIASNNGSISLSLAVLPLLTNKTKARTICANTFQLCLSACTKPQSVHHSVRLEASDALSDLFRFGLKLEDTTDDDAHEDEFLEKSFDAHYFDDSSDDEDKVVKQPQYGMFCGISRLFGGSAKSESRKTAAAADSFIDHGFKLHGGVANAQALGLTSSSVHYEGVTDVVAQMLHTMLMDVSHLMLWGSAARMASLLLPESLTGLHLATQQECTTVLRETHVRTIRRVLPKEFRRKDGLVDFFSASISRCMDCLDDVEAVRVVDLLRVVLKRKTSATDRQAEHQATLVLVLLVVGHVSGRVNELVEEDVDHLIMTSFGKAIRGPELPSESGDSDDASSQITEEMMS